LWPRYRQLATIAMGAFVFVTAVTVLASIWNSRRLPVATGRRAFGNGVLSRAWNWGVVHIVARSSLVQAGFFFTLHTLSRRVSQRVAMAASVALGLSFAVLASPVLFLAAQPLFIACVLSGFRH